MKNKIVILLIGVLWVMIPNISFAELQNKINNLKNAEDLNLYYSSIYNKHDKLWSSYQMEANFLKIKTEELGCEFDKKNKKFVSNKEEEIKVEEVKKEEVKND